MDKIQDVERIVIDLTLLLDYHAEARVAMKPFEWRKTAKEAVGHIEKLETELNELKLSKGNRLHFSKLQEAFTELKKAMKWESRGNSVVALIALKKGKKAVVEYKRRINIKE